MQKLGSPIEIARIGRSRIYPSPERVVLRPRRGHVLNWSKPQNLGQTILLLYLLPKVCKGRWGKMSHLFSRRRCGQKYVGAYCVGMYLPKMQIVYFPE